MKRFILATSTMFLLTAGAAMAQSSLNTTAPGPSQETKPGQTNNNLQNPGNPTTQNARPVAENGTVEGTALESTQRDQGTSNGTTGTTTGTMNNSGSMSNSGSTTGSGSMNNSGSTSGYGSTTGSTTGSTDSSYGTTTGSDMSTRTRSTRTRSSRLPSTGSEMPLVALIGLASLAAFAGVRASRRNA
jgi:LPXTG-motif cell wall-anchored protein